MKRYLELFRIREARLMMLSSFPARLAYGMVALAIFFKTQQETHSIALAGLAVGINGIAGAATAGLRGSLSDKYGMKWPLRFLVPSYTVALLGLNFMHTSKSILIFTFILGISAPPINLSIRPLWKDAVPKDLLRTAYAADTSIASSTNILGPVFATALALSSHPASVLILASMCMALGGGSLMSLRITRQWVPEARPEQRQSIFRYKAIRILAIEGTFIGIAFGAFEVAVPSTTTLAGVAHRTSWILGAMGLGNIIGGLLGGLVGKRTSPLRGLRQTYIGWIVVSLPLAFANPDWSLIICALFLGGFTGAQQVFYWEIVEAVRPKGWASGALGWLWTIEGSFQAGGAALGGAIAERFSPRYTFAMTTLSILVGFIIILSSRTVLAASDKIPSDENDLAAMEDNNNTLN